MRRATTVSVAFAALALLAGCGSGSETTAGPQTTSATEGATTTESDATSEGAARNEPPKTVVPAHCPPDAGPGCRAATGRIAYVERVDPDGDGDAHFVIVDFPGISLPGLTAIDVRKGLRPHPLPGVGELVSAAGPVQTGSYGQSQIHARVLHVAGR